MRAFSRPLALCATLALPASANQAVRPIVEVPISIGAGPLATAQAAAGAAAPVLAVPVLAPSPVTLALPQPVVPAAVPALARPLATAIAPSAPVASDAGRAGRGVNATPGGLAQALTAAERADRDAGGVAARAAVVERFFDQAKARPELQAAPADGAGSRWAEELSAPDRVLDGGGIDHTIGIFGSARLVAPGEASGRLAQARAQAKAAPGDREVQKRLATARREARMSRYYGEALKFARMVGELSGGVVAIVTGWGPGIMEAGNRGATEGGAPSVGFNIRLPHEQEPNRFVAPGMGYEFQDFSTRQKALRARADALVYFPGGFGTLYELFEALTLMQTGKIPKAPVVLIGKTFWKEVLDLPALVRRGLILPEDLELFVFAETAEQAWSAIAKNYPDRPEYAKRPPKPAGRPARLPAPPQALPERYRPVLQALDRAGIRHVVAGGVAIRLQGHPRPTTDLDLIVDLRPEPAGKAIETLLALGFRTTIPEDPRGFADPERRRRWVEEKGMTVLSFFHPRNRGVVVDLFAAEPIPFDELHRRARPFDAGGFTTRAASIEDLIALKRLANRPKDQPDLVILENLRDRR